MEDSEYLLDDDKECECLLNDDNETSVQQGKRNCAENATVAKHERGCKFCRKSFATFAEVKESQNPDSLVADKYELTLRRLMSYIYIYIYIYIWSTHS